MIMSNKSLLVTVKSVSAVVKLVSYYVIFFTNKYVKIR